MSSSPSKPRSDSLTSTPQAQNLTFTSLTNLPLSPSQTTGLLRTATGVGPGKQTRAAGRAAEDRIIVGIDFGTTHSAVAWALTSSPEDYEVITTWPGQVGKDWGKVPSDISYTVAENSSGDSGGVKSSSDKGSGGEGGEGEEIGYKW